MEIKRLLIKVPVNIEDLIKDKKEKIIKINAIIKNIEITISIDTINYDLYISLTEESNTIINYKYRFSSPFKILTVFPIQNNDNSILYLLKIEADYDNLKDSFYWNRRL